MNPTLIDFTKCQYHDSHATRQVTVDLSRHRLDDVPKVPARLSKTLQLTVFAWDHYSDESFNRYDFCPGQDTVSYCLTVQGIWEPVETLAVLQILQTSGQVVDVGSHFGYYCALAAASGCDVLAVEPNGELLDMALDNAANNGPVSVVPVQRLVQDVMRLPDAPIRLFIADVEGQEVAAVEYCRSSFEAGLVDYALLEISPTFNDSYPALIRQLTDWGYTIFQVPHKGWGRLDEYAEDPLGVLITTPRVIPETVEGWIQENVIAISPAMFTLLT